MKLHPYQVFTVQALLDSNDDYVVEQPTGSGKTVEMVALTACLLPKRRVLLAVTQEHIEEAFTQRNYTEIDHDGSMLACPADMILAARCGDDGAIATIRAFLELSEFPTYALACTHAALTHQKMRPPTGIPSDLTEWVLIVDEGHHGPAPGLGQFIEAWRQAGGRVIKFTATAFRSDSDPVVREGYSLIRRTLAQHMDEGYAPAHIETEIFAIAAEDISESQFQGYELPPAEVQGRIISAMVAAWKKDGKPKTIIRSPSIRGGVEDLMERLAKAFSDEGARVLDASGENASVKKLLLDTLTSERALTNYEHSTVDVIVGVQRVREGFDWPLCSTVYCLGMPGSVQTVVQLLGRATRRKTQRGYPTEHKKRARIAFFVPCVDHDSRRNMLDYHKRYTLLVCAYLSNAQAGEQWELVKDLSKGLTLTMGEPASAVSLERHWPYIDPVFRAQAELALAAVRAELIEQGSTAPDSQVIQEVYQRYPSLNQSVVRQVVVEMVAGPSAPADVRIRVQNRLLGEIKALAALGFPAKEALASAFESAVLDMDSYVIAGSKRLEDFSRQLISLTGHNMREIACGLATNRPLTPEWLGRVVVAHSKEQGRWPAASTPGGPSTWPDETWAGLHDALLNKKRNWPLETFRSLNSFVNVFVRRGTIGQQLRSFATELRCDNLELALLWHLSRQRIRIRGQNVPFGELPVPSPTGGDEWPNNYWHVLRWWAREEMATEREHPTCDMLEIGAGILAENLSRWLKAKNQAGAVVFGEHEGPHPVWAEVEDGRWVKFSIPSDCDYVGAGTRFVSGSAGFARVVAPPMRRERFDSIIRADEIDRGDSRSGKYLPSVLIVRIQDCSKTAIDPRRSGAPYATTVELPLAWITHVFDFHKPSPYLSAVPTDWARTLRTIPERIYTKESS